MKTINQDDRNGIQSVARAVSVLRALAQRQKPAMSLGEIAGSVGLPRSTVQRLVQALEQERLVEVDGPAGPGVRLGPALAELAGAIRVDIVRLAHPHLQTLFETLRETVDIARAHGREVQFLDQIASDRELRAVPRQGPGLLLHCMANGKALLAGMTDAEVEHLLGPNLPTPTARSITTLPALLAELAEIRRTGFAYDRQELSDGICAIGTAVAAGARQYAVSVVVPAHRFDAMLPASRAALMTCKTGLEADLRASLSS